MMSTKFIAVLTLVLNILGVNSYFFSSNASAYQRLDLHERHSSFGAVVCVQDEVAIVSAPYYSFNEFHDPDGMLYVYRRDNGFWTLIRGITDLDYDNAFGLSVAMHTDYFTVVGAPRDNKYGVRSGTVYYLEVESNPYKTQMEVKQLIQSERHQGALFGTSVAVGLVLNEVTIVVGAPNHRGIGAVFTYTRQHDGTLGNEEILYPSGYAPVAFGRGVQVGQNMVLGGAPGGKNGYVYVFQRGSGLSSGSFTETSVLTGISGYTDDADDDQDQQYEILKQVEEFGETISIGEGFVFVGAPYAYSQTDRGTSYGAVTVYTFSTDADGINEGFLMQEILTPTHLTASGVNSFYGKSISYSDSEQRLVVGSPYGSYPSTSLGAATVYVFDTFQNTFEQEAILTVDSYKPDANMGDLENYGETERAGFGSSVSISGGYILVGAPQGASHYGDAYFFAANGVGYVHSYVVS